ncbi:MAG: hypothetical protein ABH829_00425 [archaeon]
MRSKAVLVGTALLSATAFAQEEGSAAPDANLPALVGSGFGQIVTGSVGLKLSVVFLVLIGFAVGYYLATSGKI